ncbi:MAG: hypothetical protein LAT63_01150 [Marinobacter sp.]|nr:hypothetical protein [Marinobacter sp.]
MTSRHWFFVSAYFLVFLGGARLLALLPMPETLSFWLAFAAAAMLSMHFCRTVHSLWIIPLLYLMVFALDFTLSLHWITTAKTESLTFGIPAALIFVLPL